MDKSKEGLLKDLMATYDMQISAMIQAQKDGKMITASLHGRMARHLLDTYFDVIDKLVY